jgi:acetamidase/formamidase
LPEDFPVGQFKTIKMDVKNMKAEIAPGVVIPLKPFFGVMGVAPKEGEKRPKLSPETEEILWKITGKDFGKA